MKSASLVSRKTASVVAALSCVFVAACEQPFAPDAPDETSRPLEEVMSSPWELRPLDGATDVETISNYGLRVVGMSGGQPVIWDGGHGVPEALPSIGMTPDRPHHTRGNIAVGETWTGSRHEIVVWRGLWGPDVVTERISVELVTGPDAPPMQAGSGRYLFVATVVQPGGGRRGVRFSEGPRHADVLYLEPLPGHDETEAQSVSFIGEVVGISRSAGSTNGTITVWPVTDGPVMYDGELTTLGPVATPFTEDEHMLVGISQTESGTSQGHVYVSSLDGTAVVDYHIPTATSTILENPGDGRYAGVATNGSGAVLGWIMEGGDRRYGTWLNEGEFDPLTPGWECPSIGLWEVACGTPVRPWPFVGRLNYPEPDALEGVTDLGVASRTSTSVILAWTDIDDGTGSPARYRLKYAEPHVSWSSSSVGCNVTGEQIGSQLSCTVDGLEPGTIYDFQLYSYRLEGGSWTHAARSNIASAATSGTPPPHDTKVDDLYVLRTSSHTLTVRWTQVDDGTGEPAWYRLKYAESPLLDWRTATIACDRTIKGDEIESDVSCEIGGLEPGVTYDVQLMSFKMVDGRWQNARFSNLVTGTTRSLGGVGDLTITSTTSTSMTLSWTQVEDGTGAPARDRVKYAISPMGNWSNATVGCNVLGATISNQKGCIITGLRPNTTYDVQLMSYRLENGFWENATFSNLVTGATGGS